MCKQTKSERLFKISSFQIINNGNILFYKALVQSHTDNSDILTSNEQDKLVGTKCFLFWMYKSKNIKQTSKSATTSKFVFPGNVKNQNLNRTPLNQSLKPNGKCIGSIRADTIKIKRLGHTI